MSKNIGNNYRYFGMFRMFLAALVMLQHFIANAAPIELTIIMQPYEIGTIAVLTFFCLSGFVIGEATDIFYRKKPKAFITNRLLRIYPHFIVAITLSIGLHYYFIVKTGTFHVERFGEPPSSAIFNTGNLILNYFSIIPYVDRFTNYRFLHIAWAVKVEMVFYLAVLACLITNKIFNNNELNQFGLVGCLMCILFLPLFILSVKNVIPPLFIFFPYFTYGIGLYFALKGHKAAKYMVALSIPLMLWQFLAMPAKHPELGFERAIYPQLVILIMLIGLMTRLAYTPLPRLEKIDRFTGTLTYPLYIYHYIVLIIITGIFTHFTYTIFISGLLVSILVSHGLSKLIDPTIDAIRNYIRGQKLSSL